MSMTKLVENIFRHLTKMDNIGPFIELPDHKK